MSEKMDIQLKKCITPKFRVSFPNVLKAKAFKNQEPKFSITMLFDQKTDLKEVQRAYKNAGIERWGKDQSKWPKFKNPTFRDGNEKQDLEGYEDVTFCTASSKTKPGLINENHDEIITESEFYAGCYAKAELIAFAYGDPKEGIPYGIGFSLQNLKKVGDGKSFSGRRDASEVFEKEAVDSDNKDNYEDDDVQTSF